MADTESTTVHTTEIVRYDDPVIIAERVAVAAFISGYKTSCRPSSRERLGRDETRR